MSPSSRLHPGQLVILWAVAIGIEVLFYNILGAIDIPLVPVPGLINAVYENWMSGPGFVFAVVLALMLATVVFVLVKTWRWFGASVVTDSTTEP